MATKIKIKVAIIKLTEFNQQKDVIVNKQGFINKYSHYSVTPPPTGPGLLVAHAIKIATHGNTNTSANELTLSAIISFSINSFCHLYKYDRVLQYQYIGGTKDLSSLTLLTFKICKKITVEAKKTVLVKVKVNSEKISTNKKFFFYDIA
ncbi:hypothetical protein BpHYR1_032887 [Brachionus plicatilis]|uniref:Uncharacterized protein n=1 Tax=Brachionus plicatilis TaxID=10195 RepID=A0A3M7PYD6_BRAPC|nr:hypothetical protein BpHYR1_032887 [Brachionus plicatilis]